MRTFYLFKVNEDYSKLTRNIPYNLYSTYLDIKLSSKNNLDYLFNQYKSITDYLKPKLINQFLFNKMKDMDGYSLYKNIHMYNNYYSDEVSKLKVYNSYFILESNKQNSTFFLYFKKYHIYLLLILKIRLLLLKSFKNLRLV